MENEWRRVPGYPNYEINISTKEGQCRSLNFHRCGKPRNLLNNPTKRDNRIYWNLSKNGKATRQQAARWIAVTYPELVENEYFEGAEIDHKDTDRLNNHPSNLRWVSPANNNRNPLTRKHRSKGLINHKVLSKAVYQFATDGELIETYPSMNEAFRQTGVFQANISRCCNHKIKTAGGYIWSYSGNFQ